MLVAATTTPDPTRISDSSDADLQNPKAFLEKVGDQTWYYPSRSECGQCHNSSAAYVLGPKTAQLNRPLYYPSSALTANVLTTLQGLGALSAPVMPASLPHVNDPAAPPVARM